MTDQIPGREIPYNYTSLTDREIIVRYADAETWSIFESLRDERITGRSAKMLLEIYGDLFLIDRNPYVFYDFIDHPSKLRALRSSHRKRLTTIQRHAGNKERVSRLLARTREALDRFYLRFDRFEQRKRSIRRALGSATALRNIRFSAFHLVTHATDATDWRIAYPECVVYPDRVEELPGLVRQARKAGLHIIARGGGTGLTGGAIPLHHDTVVINTEKLSRISDIQWISGKEVPRPVIEVESGAVTDTVAEHCAAAGYVFATDPTSAWASTIGGNIAENAGGKKCVMWGTCIDNIYDFRIINADAETLIVRRRDHPWRKIHDGDKVSFDVFRLHDTDTERFSHSIDLHSSDIRRKGLGKDITNKALKGLPGIQKEGGDGIISSARFVLYEPFSHARTLCLEFFGSDMKNAARAIVEIREQFSPGNGVVLTALEHFDDKYVQAIGYDNKGSRRENPKAVLIIDVESHDPEALDSACQDIVKRMEIYETEAFIAESSAERTAFWKDRKNLGAIARHTNAFKLNEDIVIPLESLPDFTDFIDRLNVEKELQNQLNLLTLLLKFTASLSAYPLEKFPRGKLDRYCENLLTLQDLHIRCLKSLDSPSVDLFPEADPTAGPLFKLLGRNPDIVAFQSQVQDEFISIFHNHETVLKSFRDLLSREQRRKIVIATHMHAGDGNSHVNIPVLSSDAQMMKDANDAVDRIMAETRRLGGVVSGEHGIGITKLKYLDDDILRDYAVYKAEADPEDLFNPGKLRRDFPFDHVYTPSFNLLEIEAFALAAMDLHGLSESIANCVRCGRCKGVCNTHFPKGNMLYNPRNKILALGLIIEAVLYDVLTSKQLSFRHFEKLTEIAGHCTLCHKCQLPCPVNIDFGEVTLRIRRLMTERKRAPRHLATALSYRFLSSKGYFTGKLWRWALFRFAFNAQRLAHALNRPFRHFSEKIIPHTAALLRGRFPKTGSPSLREILGLRDRNMLYTFVRPDSDLVHSVFYFPGCGSERMFPDISIAALAMLWESGVRVIIPPEYSCCGYPYKASGNIIRAEKIKADNTLRFHRIAYLADYMNIEAVLVSCGTCYEMLESYDLQNIFKESRLRDVSAYLHDTGLLSPIETTDPVLFHEPCHSSLREDNYQQIFVDLIGQEAQAPPNCCGDGGTMALATPHISNTLRDRKLDHIRSCSTASHQEVLTACPSCVMGLSKINESVSVSGKHLIVWLAEKHLGKHWKRDFIRKIKNSVEKTLLA